jgi:hypothetical protein
VEQLALNAFLFGLVRANSRRLAAGDRDNSDGRASLMKRAICSFILPVFGCACGGGAVPPDPVPVHGDIGNTSASTAAVLTCCPVSWDMYSCTEIDGGKGLNCHNPELGCASSLTCGRGCDFEVEGRCPVCDPILCPAGDVWDSTLCKCVPGCVTATDCTGPLPDLCRVCANGSAGCAHWACVNHACQIEYCQ